MWDPQWIWNPSSDNILSQSIVWAAHSHDFVGMIHNHKSSVMIPMNSEAINEQTTLKLLEDPTQHTKTLWSTIIYPLLQFEN